MISQIPPAVEPPPGCHIPLNIVVSPMPQMMPPPPPMMMDGPPGPPPPPPPAAPAVAMPSKRRISSSVESSIEEMEEERHEIDLSEFHFLLANPSVRGFRLKDKEWGRCCAMRL